MVPWVSSVLFVSVYYQVNEARCYSFGSKAPAVL